MNEYSDKRYVVCDIMLSSWLRFSSLNYKAHQETVLLQT